MYKFILPVTKKLALAMVRLHKKLLKRYLESLAEPAMVSEVMESRKRKKTLIHEILGGPYHRDDYGSADEEGVPYEMEYVIQAKVENPDHSMAVVNLWYITEDEAYEVANHFKTSIEPLELEI